MNELQRILALKKEDRTESDLAYLEAHKDELDDSQKEQLKNESKTVEAAGESESVEDEGAAEDGEAKPAEEQKSILTKNIGKTIFRDFGSEIKANGDGTFQAIVNSGAEDRHGEVLDIKGLDIKTYMTNPVLAYSHDYQKMSVGRTNKLTKTRDGKLIADFEFATGINNYHLPEILSDLYKKKMQFAFSIGFIPKEVDGNTYTVSEMIEFSPVLIGADALALLKSKSLSVKKGIDTDSAPSYNGGTMNLQEILKKLRESGMDALTLKEIAFLKENKEELTLAESKTLGFTEEAKSEENAVLKAVESIAADVAAMKAAEPVAKKDIALPASAITSKEITKQQKFLYFVRGIQSGNFKQYFDAVGKAATDPMNTSNSSQVVPPAEFILEIQRLEEQVGIGARFATVRRSAAENGLVYVLGDDDLEIYDTDEAGHKKSTSLTYQQKTLAWKKWAGILPITDELTEGSAVDLWNDAIQRFSRAYAKKGDSLIFTADESGGNNKKGILHETGTNVVTLGGDSIEDLTYDDLVDMIYGVPSQSANTGAFWMNRGIIPVLMKLKDEDNRPLWIPSVREGAPGTILGKPYYEVEVMPTLSDSESDLPFMAFGDLRYVTLGERTDIQFKMFDSGTVGGVGEDDTEGHAINLLTQDAQVLRAVKRMNAVVRFPAAFSVAKTSTGS